MYKRMLVVTGDQVCDAPVEYAVALAADTGAELSILTVLSLPLIAGMPDGTACMLAMESVVAQSQEVRAAAALWHPVWSACWTVAVHPSAWLWPCAMAVLLGCGSCARWPILTQCRASLPCRPSSQAPVRSPACKQDTTEATRLEFLPHHFLLGSIGSTGVLRYQDTSTGRIVATHRTKQVGSRVGRWWYGLFGSRWAHVRQVQMAGHRPCLCA